jgi:DNA-binding SARP family transcriptional activator
MQQGDYEAAIAASQSVLDSGVEDPVQRDHALLNLVTLHLNYGDGDSARRLASELLRVTSNQNLKLIADASIAGIEAAEDGPLDVMNRKLRSMASVQKATYRHHFGVTLFNLATNSLIQDRLADAIGEVSEAIEALGDTSASIELASAAALRLTILAQQGNWDHHSRYLADFAKQTGLRRDPDVLIDLADERDSYGAPDEMWSFLDQVDPETYIPTFRTLAAATRTRALIRRNRLAEARSAMSRVPSVRATYTGTRSMLLFTHAYLATASAEPDAIELAVKARDFAAKQGAQRWRRLSDLLVGILAGPPELDEAIGRVADIAPWHLTYVADLLVARLEGLAPASLEAVTKAAGIHKSRWLFAMRRHLASTTQPGLEVAQLLEQTGEREDVPRLRRVAKDRRRSPSFSQLGRALARRTADRVFVEDQGRVSLRIGDRLIPGGEIRRKVLALICFLISRPDLSGTRDQVLEALWPDLDPEVAVNSLNQTLYFLRRVLEENYAEDLSPGYVKHDSDVIWFDPDLLSSRSRQVRALIRGFGTPPSPDEVQALVEIYQGRFALDFEYEEWAAAYRDSLHAAFLEIVERSVLDDFRGGHYDRGITIARHALEIDPTAEQIEIGLLRLYRVTGAHAAAAEQYEHYATVMRDELGLEPLPLDSL